MRPDKDDLKRFEEHILRSVEEWRQSKKPDTIEVFGDRFKTKKGVNDDNCVS